MDGPRISDPNDESVDSIDNEVPEQTPQEVLKNTKPFQDFKKARRKRRLFYLLAIIILTAVAVYVFMKHTAQPTEQPVANGANYQDKQPTQTEQISTEIKHFDSTEFFLGFDYPANWTVVESTDGSRLTVKSPALNLPGISGEQVPGQILLMLRNETQKLPEFDKGNATAVRDSEKIVYSSPGSTQRGQTYVSFLTYAGSESKGLDGIFITGDNGYKTEQAIPKADIIPIDPIVSISFATCDTTCGKEPLQVTPDIWSSSIGSSLKKILKSLSIQ